MDIRKLRGLGIVGAAGAVFRKFVYRRAEMGFYEVTRDDVKRVQPDGYTSEIHPLAKVSLDLLQNPYVTEEDLASVRSHEDAHCVLVRWEDEVVASNWYLAGAVPVPELSRRVELPSKVFYSCRIYVAPEHRGQHLMAYMMTSFINERPDLRGFCAFIFDWNTPSIRGVVNAGWRRTGTYWSTWVLGVQRSGESRVVTT